MTSPSPGSRSVLPDPTPGPSSSELLAAGAPTLGARDELSPRRARRPSEGAMIGGVAAGLAEHLGVDVLPLRIGFVVLSFCAGLGLLLYAGFWMTLPVDRHFEQSAPGLESAARSGRRGRRTMSWSDAGPVVAVGAVVVGLIALFGGLFTRAGVVWPGLMVLAGVAMLWWQADQAQRERWWDQRDRITPVRALFGQGSPTSYARVLGGFFMVVFGVMGFAAGAGDFRGALTVGLATSFAIVALIVILAPLFFRLAGDLSEERDERVRTQERADVAAHLHDSVLQTLALIQKSASDQATVMRLARSQERDLRSWLYDADPAGSASAAAAFRSVAAEVEDNLGVPIEVVCVGDRAHVEAALVAATREALVNAAKHSGADRIDLYAEIGEGAVEVFVRDRGRGYDPDSVASDRHGVSDSIVARMHRHGGSATIRTGRDTGTEVRLRMPAAKEDS